MAVQLEGQKIDIKLKKRYEQFSFDKLQMYFGEPYVMDFEDSEGVIVINMPTIGDVMAIGEKRFFATLNIFITNTTAYRLLLWENGLDWNVVTDFELFCMLYQQIDYEASRLMFGDDIIFSEFQRVKKDEKVCLYNSKLNIEINENVYQHIAQYLREVFTIYPDEKITTSPEMKQMYITKDKREQHNREEMAKQGKEDTSIRSVISACVNHPGFKYRLDELKQVGVCEFYDSVRRLQIYEASTAVLKGMYSGMVDGSKIKPEEYNFMRDVT